MGGSNSGRPRGSKANLGQLLSIDLKHVKAYLGNTDMYGKQARMEWSNGSQAGITYNADGFHLSYAANATQYSQQVNILHTDCNYGGVRPWLACPKCGGRTNKLYLARFAFTCRKCTGLAYRSQSQSAVDRGVYAVRRLQSKLQPQGSYEIYDTVPKPKRMHYSTYGRITEQIGETLEKRERVLDARIGNLLVRLGAVNADDALAKALLNDSPAPKKRKPKPERERFWA